MASAKLLKILEELTSDNMKTFKWHLKNGMEGFPAIPVSQLESASCRTDVVDIMEQRYTHEGSVKITLLILEKMGQIDLAGRLGKAHGGNVTITEMLTDQSSLYSHFSFSVLVGLPQHVVS